MKGASRPLPLLNGGRGFTLIELLITMAILAIVVSIALPMYTRYVARARQEDARVQLTAIRQAQEMYKLQYNTYTDQTSLLSGWKATSGRYAFSITGFSPTTFAAQADGNIDGDATHDIWTIDQEGSLNNTTDDVKN
jgi:prepilin-type N-terminal cleavage/methylation domain-containing protein